MAQVAMFTVWTQRCPYCRLSMKAWNQDSLADEVHHHFVHECGEAEGMRWRHSPLFTAFTPTRVIWSFLLGSTADRDDVDALLNQRSEMAVAP